MKRTRRTTDKTIRDINIKYDSLNEKMHEMFLHGDDYLDHLYYNILDFYNLEDPRLADTVLDFYTRYYRLLFKEIYGIKNLENDSKYPELDDKLINYQW